MSMPYTRLDEVDFTCESSSAGAALPHASSHSLTKTIDGIVACYCLIQAEAAVFIIAQTLPVIRVILLSGGTSAPSRLVTSVIEPTYGQDAKGKATAPAPPPPPGAHDSIELVQLESGRIVAATSEEGKAFKASSQAPQQAEASVAREPAAEQDEISGAERSFADEVHQTWADMGLLLSTGPSRQVRT